MKLKVELIYDKNKDKTQTLVWQGMKLLENKTIDGQLHDIQPNRDLVLKNYEANKGIVDDSKSKRVKK